MQDFYRDTDEEFRGVFDKLNLTPDFELFEASPASTDDDSSESESSSSSGTESDSDSDKSDEEIDTQNTLKQTKNTRII